MMRMRITWFLGGWLALGIWSLVGVLTAGSPWLFHAPLVVFSIGTPLAAARILAYHPD